MSLTTFENTCDLDLTLANGAVAALAPGAALAELAPADWHHWQRHLARRKSPRLPAALGSTLGEYAAVGTASSTEQIQPWLNGLASRQPDAALGLESIGWCRALPQVAQRVDARTWCDLTTALVRMATEAAALRVEEHALAHQLLAGELPLTLAFMLPELIACRALLGPARGALSEGPLALLDGEGLPHGSYLAVARPLLACWTRAMLLGDELEQSCFVEEAREQYVWFVRQSLRLSRADGGQLLGGGASETDGELFDAAVSVARDPLNRALAKAARAGRKTLNKPPRKLPQPAVHSEWAELAVLRTAWSPRGSRLAVNYSRGQIETELAVGGDVIWSGGCAPRVRIGERAITSPAAWAELCWHSDEDVDYLELEGELAPGWKVQRQFVLARDDLLLLVADAIIGPLEDVLHYECAWPLADDIKFVAANETTEAAIIGNTKSLWALPLALPEWRSDGRRAGELRGGGTGLTYEVRRAGQRLYAPLLFDLDRSRAKKDRTWRQLTVGADLLPLAHDVAVGYRVQIGQEQWLIYRSLASPANRTVLGQNTVRDFLFARFNRDGDVQPLVEIE